MPLEQSPTPPQGYNQRPEGTESQEARTEKMEENLVRYQELSRVIEDTTATKKELNPEEQMEAEVKFAEIFEERGRVELELIGIYNTTTDRDARKRIIETVHPDVKEYSKALSEVNNYGLMMRLFIFRIELNLDTDAKYHDIEGIRGEDGLIIPEQLNEKIRRASEATQFVRSEAAAVALQSIADNGPIDIFEKPESIEPWKSYIQTVSSRPQALFLRSHLMGSPEQTSEQLTDLAKMTSWIDSSAKGKVADRLDLGLRTDRMGEWKTIIERICTPVPILQPDGTIQMGVPEETLEAVFQMISRHPSARGPIQPPDLEKAWDNYLREIAK